MYLSIGFLLVRVRGASCRQHERHHERGGLPFLRLLSRCGSSTSLLCSPRRQQRSRPISAPPKVRRPTEPLFNARTLAPPHRVRLVRRRLRASGRQPEHWFSNDGDTQRDSQSRSQQRLVAALAHTPGRHLPMMPKPRALDRYLVDLKKETLFRYSPSSILSFDYWLGPEGDHVRITPVGSREGGREPDRVLRRRRRQSGLGASRSHLATSCRPVSRSIRATASAS